MAHQLGRTEEEILAFSIEQFMDWSAYFQIKGEEEARAMKKSGTTKPIPKGQGF